MEILKKGTRPDHRIFEVTCRNCSSELRFLQQEGRITHDPREGSFITVTCPVCDQLITVDLNLGKPNPPVDGCTMSIS